MRVAVVAEYYPREADPVLGIWAHRQAVAAREAGADVHVLVLHRPVPPMAAIRARRGLLAPLRQPLRATRDGIPVRYVPFFAPPRRTSYARWGAYAAPPLRVALNRLRPDLVHAHYAAPAGHAVRRAWRGPAVVSVHGGDLLALPQRWRGGEAAVRAGLENARLVLANSAGMARRARALGAREARVVHLGTDLPEPAERGDHLVTVGHLVARKNHADVIRAAAQLGLRYVIVGDGPERPRLEQLAAQLGAVVEFRGQLPPDQAAAEARRAAVFVMPSSDEAFGVAYVEAMAGGVPAIGLRGEDGPEEIARCGGGILLAERGELAATVARAREEREQLGEQARANVAANFTWERCGRETVAAYREALGR
jgi:glycosyltransferase involved in cell wall biosynthesis